MPKRKYTVSAKVLAANRRNLQLARAAPKELRYRATARRLAACHASLEKAHAARRDPNRPPRDKGVRHGLHAADLEHTALDSSTPRGAFARHRAAFLAAFGASDSESVSLAGAMAAVLWRRWRALRFEARREAARFARSLRRRSPEAPQAQPAGAERHNVQMLVALDALLAFNGLDALRDPLACLARRFERLARVLLRVFDQPDFQVMAPHSPHERNYPEKSEAALGNPFDSSGVVERRQHEQAERSDSERPLPPAESWKAWGHSKRSARRRRMGAGKSQPSGADYDFSDLAELAERLRAALLLGHKAETGAAVVTPPLQPAVEKALTRAADLCAARLRALTDEVAHEQAEVERLFGLGLEPRQLAEQLANLLMISDVLLGRRVRQLSLELAAAIREALAAAEGEQPAFDALKPDPMTFDEIMAEAEYREALSEAARAGDDP